MPRKIKVFVLWLSALILLLGAACLNETGDDDDAAADDDDAGDDTGEETLAIAWSTCSLEEDANDGLAQCGEAQVPLFWEHPDGRTITVAAKRWPATGESQGQLWLLQGGPGASGMMTFAPLMKELRALVPEFDLYTIDHRGVGYSSPLTCPEQEAADSEGGEYIYLDEYDDCIAWLNENLGDALQGYSTRNAAHDLAAFIDATREEGKRVFVWGASYGTYLTQRYLLLHPDQADGAIVDSIHALSEPALKFYPAYNENGKRLLQRCAEDEYCAGKLGADPWGMLDQLYAKLESGHCSTLGMDRATLSYLLGWLAWYSPLNAAAPALIYRLDRCDPADMDAIVYMFYNPFNGSGDLLGLTGGWFSQVLSMNIGMSDQYWSAEFADVDIEQYIAELNETMRFGAMPTHDEYELYQQWPRYDEPQARELPQTAIPVLMLQGDLDGATPLETAAPLGEALTGPHQLYRRFPNSAHGVIDDSWVSADEAVPTCGLSIMADFLRDPLAPPDASCIAETLPVDFAGTPDWAQYIFGTDDLWENDGTKSPPPNRLPVRLDPRLLPRRF